MGFDTKKYPSARSSKTPGELVKTYEFQPDPQARVALINAPFADVGAPSLQLGIIASILRSEGIPTDVVYLNLLFAELCHPLIYREAWYRGGRATEGIFRGALDPTTDRGDILERLENEPYVSDVVMQWIKLVNAQVPAFMDECLRRVPWSRYKLVGFTTPLVQLTPALAISRALKERHPHLITLFGGADCEDEMGEALLECFPWVDCVYQGEAESHITELVSSLLQGTPTPPIPGLLARGGLKKRGGEDTRGLFADWGSTPIPDFTDYFIQLGTTSFADEIQPRVLFEGSRGCWWGERHQCTFCGINPLGMPFRRKAKEQIVEELSRQSDRYGVRFFEAVDNILDFKAFEGLIPKLARLRRERGLSFFYELKCNLRREQVAALQEAGVRCVQPGVESFSTHILRLMRKGTTGIQNVQLLKWLATFKIQSLWNMLCGIPGEEDRDYQEMARLLPLLIHLEPPATFQFIQLERFSPYFTHPEDYDIRILGPSAIYRVIFDLPEEDLCRLAYAFEFSTGQSLISLEMYRVMDQVISGWEKNHKPNSLRCNLEGGRVRIVDERPGLPHQEVLLDPSASSIYRLCDGVQSIGTIQAWLKACSGLTSDEFEALVAGLLENFIEKGWMMREGGKYLALAVPVVEDAPRWPLTHPPHPQ